MDCRQMWPVVKLFRPRLGAGWLISTCCHVKNMFLPICAMSGYGDGCACDPVTGRVFGADFLAVGGGIMIRPSLFQFTFWRPGHKPVFPLFPLLPGAMWNTWGPDKVRGRVLLFPYVGTNCERLWGGLIRPGLWGGMQIRSERNLFGERLSFGVTRGHGCTCQHCRPGWLGVFFCPILMPSMYFVAKMLRITSGHSFSRAQGLACSYMYFFLHSF